MKFQPQSVDDPDDPRVADFFRLNDPDLRRVIERAGPAGQDFFVAEGALVIRQLLRSRYRVRALLVTEQGLAALAHQLADVDAPVYRVSQALMTSVTGFHFHRGALASAERRPHPDLATVVDGADLVLMAEGVTDNENVGALFRNAAAFGVDGVVLDATSADPLYRRSVRVSMGQVLRLPFTRVPDAVDAVVRLQGLGFEVLGLTPAATAEDVRTVASRPRQALLVGAEGPGLSDAALRAADRQVGIRMSGEVDSLNVATAAAVVLHHLARRG
ncbi:MAG: TrmH family RNA methyltransferase [Acidimicrobiales bacterium]